MISDGLVNHLYERCSFDAPGTLHTIISRLLYCPHTAGTCGDSAPWRPPAAAPPRTPAHTARPIAVLVPGVGRPTCTMESGVLRDLPDRAFHLTSTTDEERWPTTNP